MHTPTSHEIAVAVVDSGQASINYTARNGGIAVMIPADTKVRPLLHYAAGSATEEWLREQIAMETEGERTPAQTYHGEPLINVAGVVLVPASRAAELMADDDDVEPANCDCCDLRPGTHTVYAGGIETWICDECADPAPRWARRSVANAWQDDAADAAGVQMYGEI